MYNKTTLVIINIPTGDDSCPYWTSAAIVDKPYNVSWREFECNITETARGVLGTETEYDDVLPEALATLRYAWMKTEKVQPIIVDEYLSIVL